MPKLPDSDARLVERLISREPQAMAQLYDRSKGLVYSVIFHAVREQSVAEDLTQETFWRVWNRIQTFDSEKGKLDQWIATIARNRAVDHLRSLRNAPQLSLDAMEANPALYATESHESHIERRNMVLKALKSLNPAQREVIELAHYQGLTQSEIAETLQRPLGTVKSVLRSALKVLRGSMEGATQP